MQHKAISNTVCRDDNVDPNELTYNTDWMEFCICSAKPLVYNGDYIIEYM